jgi:hypothetical protein
MYGNILQQNDCIFYDSGTHKLKKTTLQAEGFNPTIVKDRLFYMNSKTGQYESLTQQVFTDITNQKIRL